MPRGHYGSFSERGHGNGRGTYGLATQVGISLFHTVGDRDRAVEQINTEFNVLTSELVQRMGGDPRDFVTDPQKLLDPAVAKRVSAAYEALKRSRYYPFWVGVYEPIYSEWRRFYADQSSWTEFMTNWDEYEHWRDRLMQLRRSVEDQVGPLKSPSPVDLSKTLPGTVIEEAGKHAKRVAEGAEHAAKDTWSMVKVAIYGALAVGGLIAVASIGSHVRAGTDPAETYYGMLRGRR